MRGQNQARAYQGIYLAKIPLHGGKVGQLIFLPAQRNEDNGAACPLELLGDNMANIYGINGKGHQGRRHMQIHKGAGHAVFPADGRDTQFLLRVKGAQESGKRLSPAERLFAQLFKILLEGKADSPVISTQGHHFGHRLHNGVQGAVKRAPLGQPGVVPVSHNRRRGCLSGKEGQLGHHPLSRRILVLAAQRQKHRCRTDGAVKPFHQSFLAAHIQVLQVGEPGFF